MRAMKLPLLEPVYTDGGFALQWTVIFTNAAADAQIAQHIGALNRDGLAARVDHGGLLQTDGLVGLGAHLFADDAGRGAGPGQAAVAVDGGAANDGRALLFERQGRDGARGAYLPAGVAAVVAVAGA